MKLIRGCSALAFLTVSGVGPVIANTPDLEDIFGSALACRIAEPSLADLSAASVFTLAAEGCVAVMPTDDGEDLDPDRLYVDADCRTAIPFEATPLASWCDILFDSEGLGEGAGISADPARASWTLAPGSRLDLGARPLDDVAQPWMQRVVYREVDTDGGRCRLEMRVYAPHPVVDGVSPAVDDGVAPSNGRALIAWHGGSWSNRGFGFLGLELTVPHFTARGFTVFAPFYRLLDDAEGSAACNQADFEDGVVADAAAAVDWVRDNSARYNVSGAPVLFGQSAGGHLAARLAADRPDDVASAVLFYAPVDFEDFLTRAQTGLYTDEQGLDIITRVVDQPLASVDVSASPVPENSLPARVLRDGLEMPPVFMVHGDADALVESRQSVRLCQAIDGQELVAHDVELPTIDRLREVFLCGDQSSLHRIRQAEHALDLCIASAIIPTDLCQSGSEASRALLADSIGSAAAFAAGTVAADGDVFFPDDEPPADGDNQGAGAQGGSGGGAMLWLLLVFPLLSRGQVGRARAGNSRYGR